MLLMAVALASFSKVKSSSYAACCVGTWDSKCWNDRGDYNFNHACYDCTNSPCANQCEYINGSYDSNAASSEACETCCRTVTHDVDWKCGDAAVDGNWGEWEQSTECSKSCGGGTQERTRSCSDPSPEYGGSNCTSSDEITAVGDEQVETDIATCNDFPCSKPPQGCWNLVSKRKCRAKLLAGKCGKPYWKTRCCKTCRGGCANLWSNKRCSKLIPHCKRSSMVKKKCRKACKKC